MIRITNKTTSILLLISMIVIVTGTFINIRGGPFGGITGAATSGNTTLIIDATIGISVIDANVSFGIGHVNVGSSYAVIYANSSNGGNLNWTQATPSSDYYMTVENTGNTNINLTIRSENLPDGQEWLCGGNCDGGDARLYALSSENEVGSCGTGLVGNYTEGVILDTSSNSTLSICEDLNFEDSRDTVNVTFAAHVPFEATTGTKLVSLVFSASS